VYYLIVFKLLTGFLGVKKLEEEYVFALNLCAMFWRKICAGGKWKACAWDLYTRRPTASHLSVALSGPLSIILMQPEVKQLNTNYRYYSNYRPRCIEL